MPRSGGLEIARSSELAGEGLVDFVAFGIGEPALELAQLAKRLCFPPLLHSSAPLDRLRGRRLMFPGASARGGRMGIMGGMGLMAVVVCCDIVSARGSCARAGHPVRGSLSPTGGAVGQ